MRRERLYSTFNWLALALGLLASILGAIALGTAWYRIEDSSRDTIYYFTWAGVDSDAAGVRKSKEYFELGLENLYHLTQATLALTIIGFLSAFGLYIGQFVYQIGKVFPLFRLSTSFLLVSWILGVLSTLTYCAAFATYSFWNNAYSRGDTTLCSGAHDLCSSFIGSSGSYSWGPYVGWAATLCATASVLLSSILFFIGSKNAGTFFILPRAAELTFACFRERIAEYFEEQLLVNS